MPDSRVLPLTTPDASFKDADTLPARKQCADQKRQVFPPAHRHLHRTGNWILAKIPPAAFYAPVIIPLVFLGTVIVGVLIYYWSIFSHRIDNLLKGEVYTRSAGIYAAPKLLHVGEAISQDELVAYLKRAGYVEKGQQAETSRGHYVVNAVGIEVEPSHDATVDGQSQFDPLRIQFARNGKWIAAITSVNGNGRRDRAQLEPELISSVTGRERAKRKVIGFNDLPLHLVKAITSLKIDPSLNTMA